jgi:hypothetical protein
LEARTCAFEDDRTSDAVHGKYVSNCDFGEASPELPLYSKEHSTSSANSAAKVIKIKLQYLHPVNKPTFANDKNYRK